MAARPPSLRAIVAFEAAARHGTFKEAARELNLTDSAVGHAIRGLEARLGVRLFARENGGLRLTARGRSLLARVSTGLSLLEEAFEIQLARPKSRLAVTVLPAFGERFLCSRLPFFVKSAPGVQLEIVSTPDVLDLGEADVDVAIRYGTGRWGGVRAQLLAPSVLIAVASPTFHGGLNPQHHNGLLSCELIDERHTPWRLAFPDLVRSEPPRYAVKVDCMSLALHAAEAGLGVALVPSLLAADALQAGRLRRLTGLEVRSEFGFWAAWRNSSEKQSSIAAFASWLAAETGEAAPV